MASQFLDNLKNAVDTGEFNSEAAKKINDINKLADSKNINDIQKKVENIQLTPIDEETATNSNTEYEIKMSEFKKIDSINRFLATLIEIEDMVLFSIGDMMSHVSELEINLGEEMNSSTCADLKKKIDEIKSKYSSLINN